MPSIRVELNIGRTHEQKTRFVEQVTQLAAQELNCAAESVDVMFVEVAPHNWARAGKFFGQPPVDSTDKQSS